MPHTLLKRFLQANAAFSGLSGLILLLFGSPLASLIGVVQPLVLRIIGGGLLLYAVDLFASARKDDLSVGKVYYFIGMDAVWVIGSAVLLWGLSLPFTPAGWWIIFLIADVVALLGGLQYYALQKTRAA